MLDIHTHILPAVDDGSRNVRQSIRMLRREARQGVDQVILTPHFYANREAPERFFKRRAEAAVLLQEAVRAEKRRLPHIYLGAELAYFRGISRAEDVEAFCIEDTNAVLIEMPFCRWSPQVIHEIISLREQRGLRPVIAHVERYLRYQKPGTVARLCNSGVWIQASADFFQDWKTSWLAMYMLKKRHIHFLGSDCHNLKDRAPNMGITLTAINQKIGKSAIRYLEAMESRLWEGE